MNLNNIEIKDEYNIQMADFPEDAGNEEYMEELKKIEDDTKTGIKIIVHIKGNSDQVKEARKKISKIKNTDKANSMEIQKNLLQSQNEANQTLKEIKNQMVNLSPIENQNVVKGLKNEIHVLQSEMQEIKNTFNEKIQELTNAITNIELKIETTNTKVQENLQDEDVISDNELQNFYRSYEYTSCGKMPGKLPIHTACELGRLKVVKKLIETGTNVNIQTVEHWTPLTYAACHGHKDIVEYLVSKNPHLHIQIDCLHYTALQIARHNKHYEIVEILKKHGAR